MLIVVGDVVFAFVDFFMMMRDWQVRGEACYSQFAASCYDDAQEVVRQGIVVLVTKSKTVNSTSYIECNSVP